PQPSRPPAGHGLERRSSGQLPPKRWTSSYCYYKRHLLRRPIESAGRVGAAGDNAATLLRKHALDRRTWTTPGDLGIAIRTESDQTYHRRPRPYRFGTSTPPRL